MKQTGTATVDFAARSRLSFAAMRYRIEMSPTRKGFARVDFAGRIIALEATQHVGPVWLVGVTDLAGEREGSVTVRADNAGDAVWRVARATVRAVAELTESPLDSDIRPSNGDYLGTSS